MSLWNVSRRNLTITLDHLAGKTYRACADEHGIDESRAHQIVVATLKKAELLWPVGHTRGKIKTMHVQELGLLVQRMHRSTNVNTPEGFYWAEERHRKENYAWPNLNALREQSHCTD